MTWGRNKWVKHSPADMGNLDRLSNFPTSQSRIRINYSAVRKAKWGVFPQLLLFGIVLSGNACQRDCLTDCLNRDWWPAERCECWYIYASVSREYLYPRVGCGVIKCGASVQRMTQTQKTSDTQKRLLLSILSISVMTLNTPHIPWRNWFSNSRPATGGSQHYLGVCNSRGRIYVAAVVIYALARSFDMSKVVSLDWWLLSTHIL